MQMDPEIVYAELKKIKKGQVISYKELATRLKRPKAVRVIASIVGKNTKPVTIPCHRVIKSNGESGEYTYMGKRDIERKISILKDEGVIFEKHKNRLGKISWRLIHAPKGAIL